MVGTKTLRELTPLKYVLACRIVRYSAAINWGRGAAPGHVFRIGREVDKFAFPDER